MPPSRKHLRPEVTIYIGSQPFPETIRPATLAIASIAVIGFRVSLSFFLDCLLMGLLPQAPCFRAGCFHPYCKGDEKRKPQTNELWDRLRKVFCLDAWTGLHREAEKRARSPGAQMCIPRLSVVYAKIVHNSCNLRAFINLLYIPHS